MDELEISLSFLAVTFEVKLTAKIAYFPSLLFISKHSISHSKHPIPISKCSVSSTFI